MDDFGAFQTLAEFAVSLAGFAGVVVAFRRVDERLHPADGIRVFMALVPTLACALLALLPIGLELTDLSPSSIWLVAVIVHALVVLLLLSAISVRIGRLPPDAKALLSRPLTVFFYGLIGFSVVVDLLSATGWLAIPPSGAYFFALLAILFNSATVFARMVFIRPTA